MMQNPEMMTQEEKLSWFESTIAACTVRAACG